MPVVPAMQEAIDRSISIGQKWASHNLKNNSRKIKRGQFCKKILGKIIGLKKSNVVLGTPSLPTTGTPKFK
jgi:hypothetical protein